MGIDRDDTATAMAKARAMESGSARNRVEHGGVRMTSVALTPEEEFRLGKARIRLMEESRQHSPAVIPISNKNWQAMPVKGIELLQVGVGGNGKTQIIIEQGGIVPDKQDFREVTVDIFGVEGGGKSVRLEMQLKKGAVVAFGRGSKVPGKAVSYEATGPIDFLATKIGVRVGINVYDDAFSRDTALTIGRDDNGEVVYGVKSDRVMYR